MELRKNIFLWICGSRWIGFFIYLFFLNKCSSGLHPCSCLTPWRTDLAKRCCKCLGKQKSLNEVFCHVRHQTTHFVAGISPFAKLSGMMKVQAYVCYPQELCISLKHSINYSGRGCPREQWLAVSWGWKSACTSGAERMDWQTDTRPSTKNDASQHCCPLRALSPGHALLSQHLFIAVSSHTVPGWR